MGFRMAKSFTATMGASGRPDFYRGLHAGFPVSYAQNFIKYQI